MADARRAPRRRPPPPVGETDAQLYAAPLVDAEGFQLVVNKHRLRSELRQPRRPPARRPVPADLIGRCFNCLAFDHVASRCSFPSRCLRCDEVGHVAKNCKRPRPVRGLRGRGRPVRRVHSSDAAAATRSRGVGRSAASASTASSGSASTGRPYSLPPSICAASPVGRPRSPSPPPVPVLPRGHPSRRPSMVVRTIPRSEELQREEDALAANALVVLVVGTRPSFAPYQVRRFIQDNYGIPGSNFTLHRHWPEDFIVIFRNNDDLLRVLNAPPVADMVLRFRRWSRLTMAEHDHMRCRVLLEIRGIPAHAWSAATAQLILGDACSGPVPTPTTTARADSRRFQATVWCSDPDLIPNKVVIRIPERVDPSIGAELLLRSEQIIHRQASLLHYNVEVEVLEVQDWTQLSSSEDSSELDENPGYCARSRSGPWPRKTVFQRLYEPEVDDRSPKGRGGDNHQVDAAKVAPAVVTTLPLSLPLRFGRSPELRCAPATRTSRSPAPQVSRNEVKRSGPGSGGLPDGAAEHVASLRPSSLVLETFDPMLVEFELSRSGVLCMPGQAETDNLLQQEASVLLSSEDSLLHGWDPMGWEAALIDSGPPLDLGGIDASTGPLSPAPRSPASTGEAPDGPALVAQAGIGRSPVLPSRTDDHIALESVRFHFSPDHPRSAGSRRNVTLSRGSLEPHPLQFFEGVCSLHPS